MCAACSLLSTILGSVQVWACGGRVTGDRWETDQLLAPTAILVKGRGSETLPSSIFLKCTFSDQQCSKTASMSDGFETSLSSTIVVRSYLASVYLLRSVPNVV